MSSDAITVTEQIERVRCSLAADDESAARELLPLLYRAVQPGMEVPPGCDLYECGSERLADTPKSLYRALWLFDVEARRTVQYKGRLVDIVSPDGTMLASIEFYKYELAVYFNASRSHIQGQSSAVLCGLPGFDNGVQPGSETARAWFGLLVELLNRTWLVYAGNNFEV